MSGFNSAMDALGAEKDQLKARFKEAGHDHARARKQLASIDGVMAEAEALKQSQQQALDEAQEKLAANSQARLILNPAPSRFKSPSFAAESHVRACCTWLLC